MELFIIGANSVVAKDIEPYAVAVGNPCHVVKKRFTEEKIQTLLNLKWWDFDEEKIFNNLEALVKGNIDNLK